MLNNKKVKKVWYELAWNIQDNYRSKFPTGATGTEKSLDH